MRTENSITSNFQENSKKKKYVKDCPKGTFENYYEPRILKAIVNKYPNFNFF